MNPDADEYPLDVGDVALDLAQGRPVHVIEVYGGDAAEWSAENNYDLKGNYANGRFGTTDADRVYECVYCSSLQSEPSKTYAFPESRLARIETESADGGRPVAHRVRVAAIAELFDAAHLSASDRTKAILEGLAEAAFGKDMTNEGRELAEAARVSHDRGQSEDQGQDADMGREAE